jgi:hypothetical protein
MTLIDTTGSLGKSQKKAMEGIPKPGVASSNLVARSINKFKGLRVTRNPLLFALKKSFPPSFPPHRPAWSGNPIISAQELP